VVGLQREQLAQTRDRVLVAAGVVLLGLKK
jgi:hypothetical protein